MKNLILGLTLIQAVWALPTAAADYKIGAIFPMSGANA